MCKGQYTHISLITTHCIPVDLLRRLTSEAETCCVFHLLLLFLFCFVLQALSHRRPPPAGIVSRDKSQDCVHFVPGNMRNNFVFCHMSCLALRGSTKTKSLESVSCRKEWWWWGGGIFSSRIVWLPDHRHQDTPDHQRAQASPVWIHGSATRGRWRGKVVRNFLIRRCCFAREGLVTNTEGGTESLDSKELG